MLLWNVTNESDHSDSNTEGDDFSYNVHNKNPHKFVW